MFTHETFKEMINVSSDSSLADVDTDKLTALSKQWVNEPQKPRSPKTKLDIIRTMESGIRSLIASGYTYEEVSHKLTSELHITIRSETVRKYLQKIDAENKKAIAKAKRDLKKSTQALNNGALSVSPSEPTEFFEDSSASTTNQIVIGSVKTTTNVSSALKPATHNDSSKAQSIVPKSVPTDEEEDDYLEQQKILKHYNRY